MELQKTEPLNQLAPLTPETLERELNETIDSAFTGLGVLALKVLALETAAQQLFIRKTQHAHTMQRRTATRKSLTNLATNSSLAHFLKKEQTYSPKHTLTQSLHTDKKSTEELKQEKKKLRSPAPQEEDHGRPTNKRSRKSTGLHKTRLIPACNKTV